MTEKRNDQSIAGFIILAFREIIPLHQASHFVASELVVFYYAFFSWRSQPASQDSSQSFSIHRKSGFPILLLGLASLMFIEVPLLHMLLVRYDRNVAWVATGFGIYAFVWVLGLSRSLALRPVVISPTTLELYKGFLWRVQVSLRDVSAVRPMATTSSIPHGSFLNMALGGPPEVVVEFAQPSIAEGPFGIRKRVNAVGLSVDEARRFHEVLRTRMSQCNKPARSES